MGMNLRLVLYYWCWVRYYARQLEDTVAIKKMNWAELIWSYLVHGIEDFKSNKQSGLSGCILFFMVMTFNLYVKLLFSIKGYHVLITFRSKLYL